MRWKKGGKVHERMENGAKSTFTNPVVLIPHISSIVTRAFPKIKRF